MSDEQDGGAIYAPEIQQKILHAGARVGIESAEGFVATHLVVTYLGRAGVYSLALLMGCTDVDPFIMGMTQSAGSVTPSGVAAAILIAAASHNLVKGIYAFGLSDRSTGIRSLGLLAALALAGIAPLLGLAR